MVTVVAKRRPHPNLPQGEGAIQTALNTACRRSRPLGRAGEGHLGNSYRVAILVWALPRVAGHARNPGLCNRNSVRVTWGAYQPIEAPSQPSPGEGWGGASGCWGGASHNNSFCSGEQPVFFTANGGFLILLLFSLPMARRGGGCWQISESGLSGISANTRRRIGRSPEKEQNFLYYSRVLP